MGRNLYVAVEKKDRKGLLICLDPDTLMEVWKFPFHGRIMPPMRVISGRLIVSSSDRKAYAFPWNE